MIQDSQGTDEEWMSLLWATVKLLASLNALVMATIGEVWFLFWFYRVML